MRLICHHWATNVHPRTYLEPQKHPPYRVIQIHAVEPELCSDSEFDRFQSALGEIFRLSVMSAQLRLDTLKDTSLRKIRDLYAVTYHLRSGHNHASTWEWLYYLPEEQLENLGFLVYHSVNNEMVDKSNRLLGQSVVKFLGCGRPSVEELAYFSLMDKHQKLASKLPEKP